MALEAVLYQQDSYSMTTNPFCFGSTSSTNFSYDYGLHEDGNRALIGMLDNNIEQEGLVTKWESSCCPPLFMHNAKEFELNSSSPESCTIDHSPTGSVVPPTETSGRRKRRRTKSQKNKEELEIQRMTHIAVERNRRKQMNEYLAVLRSLMPPSYAQRGDQASIVGGAIDFVKELEQMLQSMEVQKKMKQKQPCQENSGQTSSPFAEFFTYPQYSTTNASQKISNDSATTTMENEAHITAGENMLEGAAAAAAADIEVTMMENHANLKILSKRRPKQLLKMVVGIQSLGLSILHLNVTSTVDQVVLYSISIKVEEGSQLNTVDEIAGAVNQMLSRIHEEAVFS